MVKNICFIHWEISTRELQQLSIINSSSIFFFFFQIANAIPLLTQSDLDKAIEILDRSQHLTSLRILLSLPNGVTDNTQHKTGTANSVMMPPSNPKVGSLFGNSSKPFYVSRIFCCVDFSTNIKHAFL